MSDKKTLGIVGGMGSLASLWLFSRIIQLCNAHSDQDYLEIILHSNSKIPDRTNAIMHGGESPLPELKKSFELLSDKGIDVGVMACMTAYYFFPDVIKQFSGKLLHPVDFVIEELLNNRYCQNKKRIGLIGSTGMLKAKIFQNRLEPLGYEIVTVNEEEQERYFMYPIYNKRGFKAGVFSKENKDLFMQQLSILKKNGAELIVGACSEIPLIIERYHIDTNEMELPFIDAFDLLARKVVDYCYSN